MSEKLPFSPIALVGTIALLAAYAVAAWCVAAGIAGNARKNRRLVNSSVYGLYGFAALIGLASALMIYAFVTHDFTIKYVVEKSDTTMSTWYKVTSFWGGLDGSLLFWVLVLSLFSTIAIAVNYKRHRDMIGYVVATIMVVQVFFVSLLIFTKNPFSTFLTAPPSDGEGLPPLLQNYWMVIHPPSLYVGFVSATIPFAFAIGALASNRLDDLWLGSVRVWMLICFGFLSLGLILGGRWAYEVLGWGGYWAWDPVENAGLIPWFTATAFLHSAIIQEQRGMMKRWNLALVMITFFLTIFGTFMTRAGIVQSVHAFGEDNVLALQFVVFLVVILAISIGLLVYRSNKLRSKVQFDSLLSREFAFLLNNWVMLVCAIVVLFLTMLPTITEAIDGSRMTIGITHFNKIMTPLGMILLFLAGASPLLAYRKTTKEKLYNQFVLPFAFMAVTIVVLLVAFPQTKHLSTFFFDGLRLPVSLVNFGLVAFVLASVGQEMWRGGVVRAKQTGSDPFTSLIGLILAKRRKYGGYVVHLGMAVLFFGFGGKAYEKQVDRTISQPTIATKSAQASSFEYEGYRFVYENLIHTSDDHKDAFTAQVTIYEGEKSLGTRYPAKWDYHKGTEATTEPAIKVKVDEDVYLVLTGFNLDTQEANFRVYLNPLVLWVWVGYLIVAFGTLICLIPQSLVDRAQGKSRSRLGRAAELSILALIVGGVIAGIAGTARADGAAAGEHAPEHVQAGMGMGDDGTGWAAMYRPRSPVEEKAMKELVCMCGGCQREVIFDCKCATAAKLRAQVQEFLAQVDEHGKPVFDMNTEPGRKRAYDAVLGFFVKQYGGEQVLATPKTSAAWLMPALAAVGGVALLFFTTRRWLKGASARKASAGAVFAGEDEAYADKLDDELADTD